MDQIASGALGSLRELRARYAQPDERNVAELHARVLAGEDGWPPIALRRLRAEAASDLPARSRRIHPRPKA